jgi:dihydroorotate dehydrogenase electron transfer subunit
MPSHPPTPCEAAVQRHEELTPGIYWLVLDVGEEFARPDPGQFVFLKVAQGMDPFLRRPMSVFAFSGSGKRRRLEILYRVTGRGTRVLASRGRGERIDLVGPLGRGFERGNPALLVAGGMGVAPLAFLAQAGSGEDELLLGCRSASGFPVDFIRERIPIPLGIVTEDGSCGGRGLASDLAREAGEKRGWRVEIAAAGPPAMLRAVAEIAAARKIRCQVSLEAPMACGVGACHGCVVPTRGADAYRRVCREGPGFVGGDIRWEALP